MAEIIEIDSRETADFYGNLADNYPNQIRREIGWNFTHVYRGVDSGTVRDCLGKYWDWWTTDEVLCEPWKKIRVVPAT